LNECEQLVNGICNEKFKNLEQGIKRAHERIGTVEQNMEEIHAINEVLAKMELLTSMLREDGVNRDKMIQEFSNNQIKMTATLEKMNQKMNDTDKTIDNLAGNQMKLTNALDKLSDKVKDTDKKIDTVDTKIGTLDDSTKINILETAKWVVTIAVSAGIGAYISRIIGG
jgi:chromosome segregation ATPase